MTGGSNIRAVGPEDAQNALDQNAVGDAAWDGDAVPAEDQYWEDEPPTLPRTRFIWPTLAVLFIVAWTGFYGWTHHRDMLGGGTLDQWTSWITAWAVPVLLITSAWLLIMRNSSREAERFGVIAQTLSQEAQTLESRLVTVNRELSLAREFLAAQSRELDALGRIATERLSEHAGTLQSLITRNGEQVESIASVSATALENMGKLRDDLPVLANSAKDVSNQIGTAGMTAHTHVAELISGFERLNQFGKASENQVDSIQTKVDVALTSFEARIAELEELADVRFGLLRERSEAFRTELDGREVEALAAIRRRAEALETEFADTRTALADEEAEALLSLRSRLKSLREEAVTISKSVRDGEENALTMWQGRVAGLKADLVAAIDEIQRVDEQALLSANTKLEALRAEAESVDANIAERDAALFEKLEARRETIAQMQQSAIDQLTSQLDQLDNTIVERHTAQLAGADILAERSEAIATRISALSETFESITAHSLNAQDDIARKAEAIGATLEQSRTAMQGTDAIVAELTEACVRLLELIQASVQHSQNDLPQALGIAEARLTEVKDEALAIDGLMTTALAKSDDLSDYVLKTHRTERDMIADIDALRERIAAAQAESHEAMVSMKGDLQEVNDQSALLSEAAQGRLRDSIKALEEAATLAPATLEAGLTGKVDQIAASLADAASARLGQSLAHTARASIEELEEAVSRTGAVGRDTTLQLRDQLAKVNELAGNLETRVARAREQAEEQVNNDFARRMALLTESMNSNAIDITKAISSDVTDTAWASYLKGDRGIFTRRAVRLLDNTEARDIAEIYDNDDAFRENVSRYIHDFEAMLRSMLSTRDGNALGVTILSSDMGKLYVVLAQAIERLRD